MDSAEIVHCALQIERCTADGSYGTIVTLLGDLNKMHVSAEQLETTGIVKVLYRLLKTCRDGSVKKAARNLLSGWKRKYSKERSHAELLCRQVVDGGDSGSASSACAEPGASSGDSDSFRTAEGDAASFGFPSVRSKCVQLLLASLGPELLDQDKAAELARDIERHVHGRYRSSPLKYKACVRSKVANLRNPKNCHLQQGLLSGSLSPEAFAHMSLDEMASAELRQLREEYSSRGVSERQLPQGVEGTPTRKIRCKRCGGSDCRVTQVSRGALFLPAWVRLGGPDDDAMTFVTCSGCGQQWYHSGWFCL